MAKNKITSYGEFLTLLPCCREQTADSLLEKLWGMPRPESICQRQVPEDLNSITYGELDDLSRIDPKKEDPFVKAMGILLGIERKQALQAPVEEVFGFGAILRQELERINTLFASIKASRSSEEIAAGINDLDFGTFGVVDWYARRMGITDQQQVYSLAWIRIYTCMKNDNDLAEYSRRLNKAYAVSQKQRKRG